MRPTRPFGSRLRLAALCTLLIAMGPAFAQSSAQEEWQVDPMRGPVDLGLTDPALNGAIDVHLHLDPDEAGAGAANVRALDVLDAAKIAIDRGMRGFVFKTHQDTSSAGGAYLVRKHVSARFEAFGRMASNYASGGVNSAALQHFSQIKGGWGRIYEMPTRDSITATRVPGSMDRDQLARLRPWMLTMPPGTPAYVAVSRNGELLPEVKLLIANLAKTRTVDSNASMVLATGHATPEEHLLLAQEGRRQGLNVLLTHPGDIPQLPEAVRIGANVEITASQVYKTKAQGAAAAALVKKIGAEHIIVSTDCGQMGNVYPTDCLVLAARALRANGISPREIDWMYKINPAALLGLPAPDAAVLSQASAQR
jgi:Family of unknown function (DUF6282)